MCVLIFFLFIVGDFLKGTSDIQIDRRNGGKAAKKSGTVNPDTGLGSCDVDLSVAKGTTATIGALGGISAGALCIGIPGPGCVLSAAILGVAAITNSIPSSVCGTPTTPEKEAIKQLNKEMKVFENHLKTMHGNLASKLTKLNNNLKFRVYEDEIWKQQVLYDNLNYDNDGNVINDAYPGPFTDLLLDKLHALSNLKMLGHMIRGTGPNQGTGSIYKKTTGSEEAHKYYCNMNYRQYWDDLLIEGYRLMFVAMKMDGGNYDIPGHQKQLANIVLDNRKFAWKYCNSK